MSQSTLSKKDRTSRPPQLPSELSKAISIVKSDPLSLASWDGLNQVCRDLDRPDEAKLLYEEALNGRLSKGALDQRQLEDIGRLAADFCEEWYDNTEPVLRMLTRVLELDPKQEWAFDRLTLLLTAAGRWDSLLETYDVALGATEDSRKRQALYEEAAKIARDFAAQHERASDYLKQLLLLRLDDEQLAAAVERRFEEQGRHLDLVDVWNARLTVLEKPAALKVRHQIAERHFEYLKDSESALSALDQFLDAGGDEQAACDMLEKIAERVPSEVSARRAALERLDKFYVASSRWPAVVSVAERALLLSEDDDERVQLHRKVLTLHSQAEHFDKALEHCSAVLRIQPEAEDVRVHARKIAEKVGLLADYAEAMVAAANVAIVPERRIELLMDAAGVRAQLSDANSAIELYYRVEADEASTADVKVEACRNLTSLLASQERAVEVLPILERWAKLEAEIPARRAILARAAHLARQLGQGQRALDLWAACLADDGEDDEALSERIDLLLTLERPAELVVELKLRSLVGTEDKRNRADLILAANTYRDRLSAVQEAVEVWRTVEERFGRNEETIDALSDLLSRSREHRQLVQLLDDAIAKEPDLRRKVEQLVLLGDTLRHHLDDAEGALSAYARGLTIDIHHAPAREGLRHLLDLGDLAHRAGECLVEAYRAAGDEREIVELSEHRVAAAPSVAFQADVLLEVASIETRSQEPTRALAAVSRAFSLVPSAATEAELHRLGTVTQQWSSVVTAYAEAIERCEEPTRLCSLYLMKGNTERSQLNDARAATGSYVAALTREPGRVDIAHLLLDSALSVGMFAEAAWGLVENSRALDVVSSDLLDTFAAGCGRLGDWDGALEGLGDRIASAETMSPRVAHDIKRQLATWYRDQLNDPDSAELVLKRAVVDLPERGSLLMLAELQRRAPGRPLVATLCLLSEGAVDVLEILREAAEVALGPVADPDLATPILERALAESSEQLLLGGQTEGSIAHEINAWCTDRLLELALAEKDFKRGVELLEASAALPFSSDVQIQRLFRAAEVASAGGLDDVAVKICEAVLEREPHHDGVITLLSSLHEKAGRLEALLSLRRRELLLERPLSRRLFLRLDQARVLGELAGPDQERLRVLRDNLIDQAGHESSIVALDEILTQMGDFEGLVRLYEEQADLLSTTLPDQAARLWERAGHLAMEHLAEEVRLTAAFKKAAALAPSVPVVERLARLAQTHAKWEEQVAWLTLQLDLTPRAGADVQQLGTDRRAVVVALGHALVKTDEWTQAAAMLERELLDDPAANEGRQLLARIYRELNEWAKLSELLEVGVAFAPGAAEKVSYLREAALVHRKYLEDIEAAIPLLDEAIALDGSDRSLKLLLADTLRNCQRYEEAREILKGMLEEFGRRRTRERAMVHMQLARIAESLNELDEAIEQADAAANIERSDAAILMLVGELARRKGALDRAEQAYRTLALIAGRRSAQSTVESVEDVGESAVLFQLHRIATDKGELQQAKELLDSAISVATRDDAEALRLAGLLAETEQVDLLLAALQVGIHGGLKGEAAAVLLIRKANVLEQRERSEEAFAVRLQALTEAPGDLRLLDATQKLAERLSMTDDLWAHVSFLAEQAVEQPSVSGELWFRAGQAAEAQGDRQRAAECYERAQQSEFKPRRAFQALDSVLDEATEPERVRRALNVFVRAPGAEANASVYAEALYRLADMDLLHGELDEATDLLARAMSIEPQADRVVAMLESSVRDGSASPKVVGLFLSVCKKSASEDLQLFAYQRAIALDETTATTVQEAISLARRLDNQGALRALLSRAIDLAGSDVGAVSDLIVERANMARSDGERELEVRLLTVALPCFDGATLFDLKLRLAGCYGEDERTQPKALEILEELFASAPTDGRVWRPLLGLYRHSGSTAKIEEVIELIADDVSDESDVEALKIERVRLMMRDGRNDEAETELRAVLDVHPQMSDAASLLIEILRAGERWDELNSVLVKLLSQARRLGHAKLVAQYCLERAKLLEASDHDEAISVLVSDLGLTKTNHELLSYLLSLYTDADNQSERADVMEHLIAVSSPEAAKLHTLQLVELRASMDDRFGIVRALELGVRAAPRDVELAERLIVHLRTSGDHGGLADALITRAQQLTGLESVAYYAEAGALLENYLGEPLKAAAAYESAHAADPSDVRYLLEAIALLVSSGEVEQALMKVSAAIETSPEFMLADILQVRATIILREKFAERNAMAQAALDLTKALQQFIPEEQEREIQELRVQVLSALRVLHAGASDASKEREVVEELSDLLLTSGRAPEGLDVLVSFLRDHSTDRAIALRIGERAMKEGAPETAMFGYQKLAETSEGQGKIAALLELSGAARAAGEPQLARIALEDALTLDPQNQRVIEQLRTMYTEVGAFGELAAILQAEADKQQEASARFALLVQIGELHLKAAEEERAIEAFMTARRLNVNNSVIVARLAQVHLDRGETEEARRMLDEAIKEHGKRRSPELALLQQALAHVEEAEENVDATFAWLEAALISDRNNAEIASELAVRAQAAERYDIAIKALQNLTLNKSDAGMSKAEAYLRQAQIAAIVGDDKKALLMARRAQAADDKLAGLSELLSRLGA